MELRDKLSAAYEKLVLERTIELLVAAGHVTQETVEKARQIVMSYAVDAAEQFNEPDTARCTCTFDVRTGERASICKYHGSE